MTLLSRARAFVLSQNDPEAARQPGRLRVGLMRFLLVAMAACLLMLFSPLAATGRVGLYLMHLPLFALPVAMAWQAPALCRHPKAARALLIGYAGVIYAVQLLVGGVAQGFFLPAGCVFAPSAAFLALPPARTDKRPAAALAQDARSYYVLSLLLAAAAEIMILGTSPAICALAYLGAIVLGFTLYTILSSMFTQTNTALESAQQLRDSLRETQESLQQAARTKDDFLANMSHEIRTPMHAISGMADMLLLSDQLGIAERTQAENIKLASQNLLSLIGDILDISKIRVGKLELYEERYDFPSLLADVTSVIYMRAQERGLLFLPDIDPDIPKEMQGDSMRIRQVLLNLLGNAVKFTEEGSVRLIVRRLYREGDLALRFEVSDTGCGIAKEDMKHLYGIFEQLSTTWTHNREGTGLGLAISRSLVELMGGELQVESTLGRGTTFSFEIEQKILQDTPVAQVEDARLKQLLVCTDDALFAEAAIQMAARLKVKAARGAPQDAAAYTHMLVDLSGESAYAWVRTPTPPTCRRTLLMTPATSLTAYIRPSDCVIFHPLHAIALASALSDHGTRHQAQTQRAMQAGIFKTQGVRVLVVDDNGVAQMVVANLLSRYGIATDCVQSGRAAISALENAAYDIVFLDHVMPGMDGVDTARAIRQMGGRFKQQVVIMLSANVMPESRRAFLEAGVNDTLAKPIELHSLSRLLHQYLPPEKQVIERESEHSDMRAALAPLLDLPFKGIDEAVARGPAKRERLIASVARAGRRLPEHLQSLREASRDRLAVRSILPVLRCVQAELARIGDSALGAQVRLLTLQAGDGAFEGVREALPRVCEQLDALCERLNACIEDMHLPVHAETHDLALNVREYMMLYDLPRARETVDQLLSEGGELVRPCAQALSTALAECDWTGADTCLQQMLALLFDGAADEGEE